MEENLLVHSLIKKFLIFTSISSINLGLGIGKQNSLTNFVNFLSTHQKNGISQNLKLHSL